MCSASAGWKDLQELHSCLLITVNNLCFNNLNLTWNYKDTPITSTPWSLTTPQPWNSCPREKVSSCLLAALGSLNVQLLLRVSDGKGMGGHRLRLRLRLGNTLLSSLEDLDPHSICSPSPAVPLVLPLLLPQCPPLKQQKLWKPTLLDHCSNPTGETYPDQWNLQYMCWLDVSIELDWGMSWNKLAWTLVVGWFGSIWLLFALNMWTWCVIDWFDLNMLTWHVELNDIWLASLCIVLVVRW